MQSDDDISCKFYGLLCIKIYLDHFISGNKMGLQKIQIQLCSLMGCIYPTSCRNCLTWHLYDAFSLTGRDGKSDGCNKIFDDYGSNNPDKYLVHYKNLAIWQKMRFVLELGYVQ